MMILLGAFTWPTVLRGLLALVLRERLAQLLDGDLLLLGRQDDLARQHDRHRAGRRGEEVVDRAAEPLCASSTAVERSGPICAGLFTPKTEIEWQTKHPVCTNQAPGPVFIRSSAPLLGGLRIGARRARDDSAGTGALRHESTSIASACASFVVRWKFGMTVSGTSARGSLKCATCQANAVFWPERRPKSYLLGRLVADEREVGADRAAAAVDHVAGAAALVPARALGEVDGLGALGLAVVAVADVAVHLHERASCRPTSE